MQLRNEDEIKLALACTISDWSQFGINPIATQLAMLLCWVLGGTYPRLEQALKSAKELTPEQREAWLKLADNLVEKWNAQLNVTQAIGNDEPRFG
jgi:hypothetical protein